MRVRAVHFNELRSAIQGLWTAITKGTVPGFTAGAIVADTRLISARDLADLRSWLGQYESDPNVGSKRARAMYFYDAYDGTTQFGRGKRTSMWDALGWSGQTWDKAGRLVWEGRGIDGRGYETRWSYDAADRVYQLTLPDGEVLTHSYAAGLLAQLASSLGGNYLSGVQYNALDLPKQYTLGSGTTALATHSYYGPDASGSPYGGLKTITLRRGSDPFLVNRDIGYDYVGNVLSVNDLVSSENITYLHDHLDRLTSAGSPIDEGYVYNQIGNMTSKGGLALTYGDAGHKHAVTAYNGVSYAYDQNGCMTTRGSQTIRYNPENMPVRVDSGGATICRLAYDGDNVRRKRLDSSGTIHYLGSYERNVGNGQDTTEVVSKYYFATMGKLARLIAFRRAGVLYYVGADHLGSTVRVADASFNPSDQMRYKPYGQSRDAGTNLKTDHKFTSQIEDAIVGLYWYNARAYDPVIGRFVAPDTIVPEPKNPQALNRYSYALNAPTRYTDPTGHDVSDWFDDAWKAEFASAHPEDPLPEINAYAYRYYSMAWVNGMIDGQYHVGEEAQFPIPAGADLAQNIRYGLAQGTLLSTPAASGSYLEFARLVLPHGKWDYIDYSTGMFEEFGNFNFGAAGAAWGFSEGELLRGAGGVQLAVTTVAKAVEALSFGRVRTTRKYSPGSPWGDSPYGDDPSDQPVIKAGIDFYRFYSTAVDISLRRPPPRPSYFGTLSGY